jgi:pyrroloquinoline-quinone synthase
MTSLLDSPTLAAPPPPPIPELTAPLEPEAFVRALRAFHRSYYVEHPFHRLMHEGKLSRRQLQGWVANRLCYQRAIPRKDGAIIANCPVPEVRRRWIQRIIDHDGTREGEGGIEMWIRLGMALGLSREELEDERHVLPGVRFATEAYVTFCKTRPWVEGVAASLTELFAPDIMQRRLASLPKHYPWIPPEGYAYFTSRLTQAPRDSAHGLEIVTAYCTTVESQRRAFEALTFKIEMLWVMIDTIHHAYADG